MPKTYTKIQWFVKRLEEVGELNDLRFEDRAKSFGQAVRQGVMGESRIYWKELWLGGDEKAKQIVAKREELTTLQEIERFDQVHSQEAAWIYLAAELAGGLRKGGLLDKSGQLHPRYDYDNLLIQSHPIDNLSIPFY